MGYRYDWNLLFCTINNTHTRCKWNIESKTDAVVIKCMHFLSILYQYLNSNAGLISIEIREWFCDCIIKSHELSQYCELCEIQPSTMIHP
jgi:hypothetical protein